MKWGHFAPKTSKNGEKIVKNKEFLYVGYYIDTENRFILKIGTTNDLDRRRTEHTRNYHRNKTHTLPPNKKFEYLWSLPLSKYNTIRFEDSNREKWIKENIGEFVRNDRFVLNTPPEFVEIAIRKTYKIALPTGDFLYTLTNLGNRLNDVRQMPKIGRPFTLARAEIRQNTQFSKKNFRKSLYNITY